MKRAWLIFAVVLIVLLSACGTSSNRTESSSNSPPVEEKKELVPLKVGAISCSDQCPFEVMGIEKGFYEKYGVDVEFVRIEENVSLVKALIAGDLDLTVSGFAAVFNMISEGNTEGIKLVATHTKKIPWSLYAKPEIQQISDLKGKSIGISQPGTQPHVINIALLEKHGVNPNDVQWINSGGNVASLQALLAGQIDATSTASHYIDIAEKDGFHIVAHVYEELPWFLRGSFFASRQAMAEKREAVQGFLLGYSEGVRYAYQNRDELNDLAAKLFDLPLDAPEVTALFELGTRLQSPSPILDTNIDDLEQLQEFQIKVGAQNKRVDLSEVVDNSLAQTVHERLGPFEWPSP